MLNRGALNMVPNNIQTNKPVLDDKVRQEVEGLSCIVLKAPTNTLRRRSGFRDYLITAITVLYMLASVGCAGGKLTTKTTPLPDMTGVSGISEGINLTSGRNHTTPGDTNYQEPVNDSYKGSNHD